MKRTLVPTFITLGVLGIHAKPIPEGGEIDSHEAAFHHAIHESTEFHLVCVYDMKKKPVGKAGEELEIQATIIRPIKGDRPVGAKISFKRFLDGKYGDISSMDGTIYFVRFDKVENEPGKVEINPQDPHAVFRSSEELLKIAREHEAAKPVNR